MRDAGDTWAKGWRTFRRSRVMVFLPFTLSFMAGIIAESRRQAAPPDWLPTAQKLCGAIGLLYLVFPFWFQRTIARNPGPTRARGKDPDEVVLLVTTTMSGIPAMLAFFLCVFGGPARHVYYASVVSVLSGLFWAWRFRHLYSELQL